MTGLGAYDVSGTGFNDAHDIGIFLSSNSSTVVSATVTSGTVDPLTAGLRFVSVAPVILTAGTQYYILGDNWSTDAYHYGTGAVSYASEITWNGYTDGSTNSIFSSPNFNGGVPGNLGPNFEFSASTPEPASTVSFAFGLADLGLLVFRARRRNTRPL